MVNRLTPHFLLIVIFVLPMLATANVAQREPPSCLLVCGDKDSPCQLTLGQTDSANTYANDVEPELIRDCANQRFLAGKIHLYFIAGGNMQAYSLKAKQPPALLQDMVKALKAAQGMRPEEMSSDFYNGKSASVGGKGIDTSTQIESDGSACAMGLPCGIVLPAASQISIQLEKRFNDIHSIEIKPFRAEGQPASIKVEAGWLYIPDEYFKPSHTYHYTVKSNQRPLASGYYQVASQKDVDFYLQHLGKKQLSNDVETLTLLYQEGFLWDLGRLSGR